MRTFQASALPSAFAAVALLLLAGCQSSDRTPLGASDPLAERQGGTLVVRWENGPTGAKLPIYAGPSPEQIDHSAPVGHLESGHAEIASLPFDTRPYLEIELPGGEKVSLAERQLPLQGMDNFRDLGGYRTSDGHTTRWGRVYRSGQLSGLSDGDLDYMHHLGVNLVCDFRSPAEREDQPDRLPDDDTPLVIQPEIYTPGVDPKELQYKLMTGDLEGLDLSEFLVDGNRAFVTQFAHQYRTMFDHLLEEDGLPAVLHCTAGKDRAGMAAALVLLAVGVPEETVMRDFLLTNHYTHDKIQQQLAIIWVTSLFRSNPGRVGPLVRVEPRYLQAGLDAMVERDGSVDGYLRNTLGLTDEKRQRLRDLLLEPQPEPSMRDAR
ncbi:MAG: tyrosine-protein phosphatase [Candidatus Binatia bacterium]|nr:tyrosine-protein phosphatase [Candidatus Binatia bacterium]